MTPSFRRRGDEERLAPGTPLWAELYPEHIQRYEFAARNLRPGGRVLDAGCGVGYGAAFLVDRGAGRVVAVDISREALEIARSQFHRSNVVWIEEDCLVLERAGQEQPFDVIVNLENLEHLSDPARFVSRAAGLLGSQGVFVCSTPDRIGINRLRGLRTGAGPANPFHAREYTTEELRALLEPRFASVELAYQTLDPIERMAFEPALAALWHNPASRVGRWAQRLLGRPAGTTRLEDLLPSKRWQILDRSPGEGMTVTLLAVCRGPRPA